MSQAKIIVTGNLQNNPQKSSAATIERAAELLKQGLLVAFPTETVYGLGADASSDQALKRLYAAKGRPADHPVIVHLGDVEALERWATRIPDAAYKLAEAFWPGPMTLILPRASHVCDLVTGGQDSVGLRVPSHPVALELLASFGGGLAAPSANRFGRLSPTTAGAVYESLGEDVAMIIDGGPCQVGIESTIISLLDYEHEGAKILRPGMITAARIDAALSGAAAPLKTPRPGTAESPKVRVPGALASHYAPRTPLAVASTTNLIELYGEGVAIGRNQAVLASPSTLATLKNNFGQGIFNKMEYEIAIPAPEDADSYARTLYDNLRRLDNLGLHKILVEAVPESAEWDGVRDRLSRAAVS